ncbi:UNVERIFIED_CONTAM: hypothetical protein PYX00_005977 [Menopon gallinae]|uniref:WD repeat-containing protein 18 n=1 Tax=Menopon gallinae TaxID=328185 RepID=A0AAW2HUP5_9NEOP
MTSFNEVLFIGDGTETSSTIHCYDLQLGVRVMTYKGANGVTKGTLNLIGEDYLMMANVSKPFLHVWPLNKEEQFKRLSMPGRVTALAVSENGLYTAAGIDNKIYVWNVSSGQLLNVVVYHHEPITKIVFWGSSYFITAGADGLVAVWRLVDVVTRESGDTFSTGPTRYLTPFFSSSQHSLPVADVHVASGGVTARMFTVSSDQTCQIFSLGPDCGKFLLTLTFDYVLTSVLADRLQRRLFLGTSCGKVIIFPLEPLHGVNVHHVDCSSDENILLGHEGCINALSLSQEDSILASGSADKKVLLWNTTTKQQVGVYQMHGPVTDVLFRVTGSGFLSSDAKPTALVSNFDRTILSKPEDIEIKVMVRDEINYEDSFESEYLTWRKALRCAEETAVVPESSAAGTDQDSDSDEEDESIAVVPEDPDSEPEMVQDMEEPHPEGAHSSNRASDMDYDRLQRMDRELTRLKLLNRRLTRVNKTLYMFGLEQVCQNRRYHR